MFCLCLIPTMNTRGQQWNSGSDLNSSQSGGLGNVHEYDTYYSP